MDDMDIAEAISLSAIALGHARRGNWDKAVGTMEYLNSRFPDGSGIQMLMQGCADTVAIHQGAEPLKAAPLELMFVNEAGDHADADSVDPDQRWAGRFIAARAAGDKDTCAALVDSCESDQQYAKRVGALLQVAAITLNMIEAPK